MGTSGDLPLPNAVLNAYMWPSCDLSSVYVTCSFKDM